MKLQGPKGTRDFYPDEMAKRNYLLDAWRRVSIRNGFEQVDGPIFETLDLYKVKSGEGIVSELFHFEDRGGRELAIRPEFTPTLARMVAAKASSLPKPIKWFCVPNFCRAERPQRGRLREFWQWNVDILGVESPVADAEVIFTAIDLFQEMGLTSQQVRVKISHRETVRHILEKLGVPDDKMLAAFELLDRRDKMEREAFTKAAAALGLDEPTVERFEQTCRRKYSTGDLDHLCRSIATEPDKLRDLIDLDEQLRKFGVESWCEYDLGIVRGLAYYTGMVFEIHEVSGAERAIAGGGRYDKLIEMFGGPATSAVGFGMGDVVLTNVLIDKLLLPDDAAPRPDVFVLAASDQAAELLPTVTAQFRRAGLHTRFTYKTTRSIGKLLKDATNCRARYAAILDDRTAESPDHIVSVKNLDTGEQMETPLAHAAEKLVL